MDEKMQAGKYKSECLKVMERVRKTRRKVIITKRNVPVAKLVPIEENEKKIVGALKGSVHIIKDIVVPIDEVWNADS